MAHQNVARHIIDGDLSLPDRQCHHRIIDHAVDHGETLDWRLSTRWLLRSWVLYVKSIDILYKGIHCHKDDFLENGHLELRRYRFHEMNIPNSAQK